MKLIFLHGAPASGKLTVAKALLRIVPGRLRKWRFHGRARDVIRCSRIKASAME
jgi:tRNA uridine 5-carbamoylmethylation protein Kti12